jgi:hypothetical protein
MPCCFSCRYWDYSKSKKIIIDLPRVDVNHDNDTTVKIRLADGTRISKEELANAMMEGSIRQCKKGIVRPWNEFRCFESKFTGIDEGEEDIDPDEVEVSYLACWTPAGCPFKEKCYMKSSSYFM